MRHDASRYSSISGSTPAERRDCFPRALSLAANMPYQDAMLLCAAHGRKPNRGTPWHTLRAVMDVVGATTSGKYGQQDRPTLAQWVRQHPHGRYVVIVTGHAVTVIDGVVHDWNFKGGGPRRRVIQTFAMPA